MRKLSFLAICAVFPAWGQFSSMSTDYTGQRLLFTTTLSQAGSSQPTYGKVFVADSQGVRPLVIYNLVIENNGGLYPGQPGGISNFYDVEGVAGSSDDAYISVAAWRACAGYTAGFCGVTDQSLVYDMTGRVVLSASGRVFLSPSGKWAVSFLKADDGTTSFELYEVGTATKFLLVGTSVSDDRFLAVADDGTAVIGDEVAGVLVFRTPTNAQTVGGTQYTQPTSAVIDPAATVVVWVQQDATSSSLHAAHTADLANSVSLGMSGWSDSQPSISNDGNTLLFLSTPATANDPQIFLMAPDGTARRKVTAIPEGISQAVLSGNGQVAWAQTRTGRLVQVDLVSGAVTQYVAPLAAFLNMSSIPGGSPGDAVPVAASVMPGERVEIFVQGQRARILSLEPQVVEFQMPCTISANENSVQLSIVKPDSPSWSGDTSSVFLTQPQPYTTTMPCEGPPDEGSRGRGLLVR